MLITKKQNKTVIENVKDGCDDELDYEKECDTDEFADMEVYFSRLTEEQRV